MIIKDLMATFSIYKATKFTLLLDLILIKCLSAEAASFCNYGQNVDALQNETCSTKMVHVPSTLVSDDRQTSVSPLDDDFNESVMSEPLNNGLSMGTTESSCYIFRYISTTNLPSGDQQKSIHKEFGCDFKNLCAGRAMDEIHHNVVRHDSQLYCCSGNNCNTVKKLPVLAVDNQVCYSGTNKDTDKPSVDLQSCSQPDVSCAKRKTFYPKKIIEHYFCDNERVCHKQMSSGSFRSCENKTTNNITEELCCCKPSRCYKPPWPVRPDNTSAESKNRGLAGCSIENRGDPSKCPSDGMGKTIEKPEANSKKTSPALVTGLVVAIVVMASIAAASIFVAALKQKKKQRRRDPNVIMQYERLSASDVEIEEAVVL